MSEERIVKLEVTMEHLADSVTRIADNTSEITKQVSDVLTVVAIQQEKDKTSESRQHEINKNVHTFIAEFKEHDRPIIDRSNELQLWCKKFLGKFVAPAILGAILLAAGAQVYDKAITQKAKQSEVKSLNTKDKG